MTNVIGLCLYIFNIYLLWSSVKLMRRFLDDHSRQKSNEKTACLHIVMMVSMLVSSTIYNLLMAISKGLKLPYPDLETRLDLNLTAKLIKSVGGFIACIILIYMFWGYALSVPKLKKIDEKKLMRNSEIETNFRNNINSRNIETA